MFCIAESTQFRDDCQLCIKSLVHTLTKGHVNDQKKADLPQWEISSCEIIAVT